VTAAAPATTARRPGSPAKGLLVPGLLLGLGLGGFVDGIVLHQVLQWHHMLTSEGSYPATTVAGLEINTLWDGLFHLATLVATTAGVLVLASRVGSGQPVSLRVLVGLILAGWGTFNLVEGVVDHHILGIHHVKAGEPLLDLAFLALGALLVAAGVALARGGGGAGTAEGSPTRARNGPR
jgi:uncharacterized membrane protein